MTFAFAFLVTSQGLPLSFTRKLNQALVKRITQQQRWTLPMLDSEISYSSGFNIKPINKNKIN